MQAKETQFWNSVSSYEEEAEQMQILQKFLMKKTEYFVEEQNKIKKTKVLKDLFKIDKQGDIARINGLRFGDNDATVSIIHLM